ncbi:MAG: hypothetical protein PHQ40_21300, partial [Anaerolineaceae bacterium]|nr:hypothetical protein [Anaerolineaceae bacterium]
MIKHTVSILVIGSLLAALISACQPQSTAPQGVSPNPATATAFTAVPLPTTPPTPGTPPVQETPIINQVPIPTPFDATVEQMVTQARDDLARQLSIKPEQIEIVDASSVTWPDSSLGCPKPGMVYTQVLVDGILIRFRVGG